MANHKRNWTTAFYWIGMVMTLGCFALILAGNTELVWRFEHGAFPLSWAFAGAAILAFLATEFCHVAPAVPIEAEERGSPRSSEWEAAEF